MFIDAAYPYIFIFIVVRQHFKISKNRLLTSVVLHEVDGHVGWYKVDHA